jgi:hypothetical protein
MATHDRLNQHCVKLDEDSRQNEAQSTGFQPKPDRSHCTRAFQPRKTKEG